MAQPQEAIELQVRLINVFEQAWRELEAEEVALIEEPNRFRRLARVRELQAMVEGLMRQVELDTAGWLNDEFGVIYGWGAFEADPAFTWTQPHLDALAQLGQEFFEDVLARTGFVRDDTKRFVRDVSRGRIQQMLVQGQTPRTVARDVRTLMQRQGISAITYRNGARVGLDTYTNMLVRTKSAQAFNTGTLTAAASNGVDWWEIIDGPECGLSFHEDGDLAAGKIVDRFTADKYIISHPNCRRSFAPRPDITSKAHAEKAQPFGTEAQRADIRAADQRRQQQAIKAQQRARRVQQRQAANAQRVAAAQQRAVDAAARAQNAAVARAQAAEAAFREQVKAEAAAQAQREAEQRAAARADALNRPVESKTPALDTPAARADTEARRLLVADHPDDDTLRDFILANPDRFEPLGRTVQGSVNDVQTFVDNQTGVTILLKRAAYIDNPEVWNETFANDMLDGSGVMHSIIRPASPIDRNGQGYIAILHGEFDPRVNTLMFRGDARDAVISRATNVALGDDLIRGSVFDYAVANLDRHGGNWLIAQTDEGPRLLLIDHGIIDPAARESTRMSLLSEFEKIEAFYRVPAQKVEYTFEHAAEVAADAAQQLLDRLPQAVMRYPERERARITEEVTKRLASIIRRDQDFDRIGSGYRAISNRLSYLPGFVGG